MEKNDLFKIRAELAGMALQGLLANHNTVKQFENNECLKEIGNITKVTALAAAMYADELLKVLMVNSMVKEVLKEEKTKQKLYE